MQTLSLSGNIYITGLLEHNHPRQVQEVTQISLPILQQLESFCSTFIKLQGR